MKYAAEATLEHTQFPHHYFYIFIFLYLNLFFVHSYIIQQLHKYKGCHKEDSLPELQELLCLIWLRLHTQRFMHVEVPLGTRHGAEPFGSSELGGRSKVFTVLTLQH